MMAVMDGVVPRSVRVARGDSVRGSRADIHPQMDARTRGGAEDT
jgi:hypothetical protein